MISLFNFIRWPNMVMIALTQCVFYYLVFLHFGGTSLGMGQEEFAYIMFNTLLITLSGYVINDYFDFETDLINKKRSGLKAYPFSKEGLKILYICLSIVVVFYSIFYGVFYEKISRAFIFLIVHALLFLYSYKLKLYPLFGNICVALLSAMVIFILYIFEDTFWPLSENFFLKPIYFIGVVYFIYAFVLSFIRELVKDIEDMEGDKLSGARTFPIVAGADKSLNLIFLSLGVLCIMTFLLLLLFFMKGLYLVTFLSFGFILVPVLYLLLLSGKGYLNLNVSLFSRILKLLMFSGLFVILLSMLTL